MTIAMAAEDRVIDASTEMIVHQGVLVEGLLQAKYHTSQPAVSQWVAVGIVEHQGILRESKPGQRMIVGVGRTEEAAIEALRERLASQILDVEEEFAVDWA